MAKYFLSCSNTPDQISQHIYRQFGLILFALEVTLEGECRVFVNPAEYLFEDYLHYGYIIAANMPDVTQLQKIKFPDYVTRSKKGLGRCEK